MKREMEGAMAKALRATGAAHKTGPCDVCGGEKARWYCAADEARLCDACDATVHSANAVARRHERVSMSASIGFAFPRRARSSRGAARTSADKKGLAKEKLRHAKIHVTVPGSDDCASRDDEIEAEDEEELVPEVPTVKAEPPDVDSTSDLNAIFTVDEFPDDIDVDSIMGVGHGFGGDGAAPAQHVHVKREGDDHECDWDTIEFNIVCGQVEGEIDDQKMMRMALDLDSDLGSMLPAPHNHSAKKLSLQLDYDDVLSAWSDRGSLWASPEDDRCSLVYISYVQFQDFRNT
eukprot:TRINITY_DN215_c0_g1_i2.p1 TRINITY_DN215_c0_g1~~TRINITY_DN215_c0_g1_i2.p1  ORF type:complete len:291 (+),score=-3.33 TRINITY_DN215_c0_g1_i2:142-1014(+)